MSARKRPGKGNGPAGDGLPRPLGPSTLAVHGGEPRPKPGHALATPIMQTATFTFADTQELKDHFEGRIDRVEYGRYGNPTQRIAEAKLAALEGAEACLLFSSGMAAMTTSLFAMLSRGTHVVVTDDSYRRTRQFLNQTLNRYGIEVSTVPSGDYEALEDAIRPTTRVLVSESPTNPHNRILDMERFAAIGRRHRVKTVVDATFATPYNQRPLEFGVDVVIHSATKYLGGHNDLMAGAVLASRDLVDAIRGLQGVTGRRRRSLRRVSPRAGDQDVRAPRGAAERQCSGAGGVPRASPPRRRRPLRGAAEPPGALDRQEADAGLRRRGLLRGRGRSRRASRIVDGCRIPYIAVSLGGTESFIEQPAIMSFYELTTEERLEIGIKDTLIRYSVGIEDAEDLIADLAQALDRAYSRRLTANTAGSRPRGDPMKVSHVTTRLIRTPADNPLVVGIDTGNATRDFVTLELGTDQGLVGIGLTFFGGALSGALREAVDALANLAIGEDPLRGEAVTAKLRQAAGSSGPGGIFSLALSAVDIALWDIKGKALGQPLATLLGGHRDRVPTYASGALMRPHPVDYLAKAGPRLKGMGFRQMKMQCGAEALPAREVERVRVMRESVGDDVDLMCDINQLWRVEQAVDIGRRIEPYHLFWLEDPDDPDDYAGLATHRRRARRCPLPRASTSTASRRSASSSSTGRSTSR